MLGVVTCIGHMRKKVLDNESCQGQCQRPNNVFPCKPLEVALSNFACIYLA